MWYTGDVYTMLVADAVLLLNLLSMRRVGVRFGVLGSFRSFCLVSIGPLVVFVARGRG